MQGDGNGKGFFGNGETWKRLRSFLLKDLYPPPMVKSYVPSILEAARLASQGAPSHADKMNSFSAKVGFDSFYSVMFGRFSGIAASPDFDKNPEDEAFCRRSLEALELLTPLMQPAEALRYKVGIQTPTYKSFCAHMDEALELGVKKIKAFHDEKNAGQLNEGETASYLSRVIERQQRDKSISYREMVDLVFLTMVVSVDTTSAVLNWTLLHLALNPDVQQSLREEVLRNLDENTGKVTAEGISDKRAPYMVATLRETHRLTSAVPANCVKRNVGSDVEIHGINIPKGNMFVMDSYSAGLDAELVDEPHEYRPERWLPEGVAARKGSKREFLDHKLYAGPFSEGARKCPGSRVASAELHAVFAYLVKEWEFCIDPEENVGSYRDIGYHFGLAIQPILPKFKFVKCGD